MSNAEMGDLFEHLIYKFAEASNEEAGEHYTPRDAIRLMVDLLFAEESEALLEAGTVRTIYDPTAGTGGMLSVAEERLLERNPEARLRLYGQEINDQSYAICKSDMIAKGQDAGNIKLGDTLADDLFFDRTFDFCMSNPPYGVDWKASQESVKNEALAHNSRFSHGLPSVGDGQMLFLSHLASKMRPAHDGGGRAGIVLNGSPLFNGAAESGPSRLRQWLLESDLVEAIVALPTNMFFNTGIATYIWILDNTKRPERAGKVQLIDATSFWTKMRKNLGAKGREVDAESRDQILALYDAFDEADPDYSKVFTANDFAYWTVTVERPLLTESGKVSIDRKGNPKPDSKLRDTENIPFTYGGNSDGDAGRAETIKAHFDAEVLPHVPDAWIDTAKTKVGYEIPFTRHFYKYVPPRSLAAIDADLEKQVAKIMELLREVEG
jgi:type I restriction enzyme M protein